jgi:hypothetical protein
MQIVNWSIAKMCAKSKSGTNAPITHDWSKLKQKIGKQDAAPREKNNELSVHVHTHRERIFPASLPRSFFHLAGGAISLFIT